MTVNVFSVYFYLSTARVLFLDLHFAFGYA